MRSNLVVAMSVGVLAIFLLADSASAQRLGRRARRGDIAISYGDYPRDSGNSVTVRVNVPTSEASLWFEGAATQQKGRTRAFVSPPLQAGLTYFYDIRATWMENGREVSRQKTVQVRPGLEVMVNFTEGRDENTRSPQKMEQGPRGTPDFDDRNRDSESRRRDSNRREPSTEPGGRETDRPITGKVVKVEEDQVTISDLQGGNEKTYRIPSHTEIIVQGKKSNAEALKPGMQVTLSPEKDAPDVAAKIEVKSRSREE